MNKLLLVLALLFVPTAASAQCNGTFANNTVCGNVTGSANLPRPTNPSAFLGAAGGTNGQIQYNNSGALGGFGPITGDIGLTVPGAVSTIQPSAVTSGKIGAGAVTNAKIAAGSNGTAKGSTDGVNTSDTLVSTLLNAACTVAPSGCATLLGYYNVVWYSAACDGTTNDATAITNAISAADGATLIFPPGKTCAVQSPIRVCKATPCADGGTGGKVPKIIEFNGSTLKATGSAFASVFYVDNNNATGYLKARFNNLFVDGNSIADSGLYVGGCGHCYFENIEVKNATGIGCVFAGWPSYGFYYNHINRLNCESNGSHGIAEYVYSAGTGSGPFGGGVLGCVAGTSYNNNNTFTSVTSLSNGDRGWDINCAHNTHFAAEAEANVGSGFAFTNISSGASDFYGGYSECNAQTSNCTVGTDTTAFNTDNSGGIYFFGGYHLGVFSSVTAANGDIVYVRGVTGFGFTANCNGSGHACVTIP